MPSLTLCGLVLAGATAIISATAYYLAGHRRTEQEARQPAQEIPLPQQYELPTLRTRPLKPAVDLQAYTYM